MAVTVAQVSRPNAAISETTVGEFKLRVVDVTFDNSYVTTGEPLAATALGWSYFYGHLGGTAIATNATGTLALPVIVKPNASGSQVTLFLYRYDGASAGKASLEEAANAFDASTFTARLYLLGY